MTTATVHQKIDRGVKRRCGACETLFYDLMHYPIQCPKCGAAFKPGARAATPASTAKRSKAATKPKSAKAVSAVGSKLDKPKPLKDKSEDADFEDQSDQDAVLLDGDDEDE